MSGSKPIVQPKDLIYLYDGTLAGFYCCVYESVYKRELPFKIMPEDDYQPSLMTLKTIPTDPKRALRVRNSVPAKISKRALELVETVFLSCLAEKELAMLRFLLLGYEQGSKVTDMLGDPHVNLLMKAEKHLLGENHLLLGFIRFADYGGVLGATITPKNFVLPFMAGHFISRYNQENFIIYDKTHGAALIYEDGRHRIISVDALTFDEPGADEQHYQSLWKRFYDTIAIKERINPKLRRTHCPKRYWPNMLEVKDLL